MDILENKFIEKYVEQAISQLKLSFPQLPDTYLKKYVEKRICQTVIDQPVNIINTYVGINQNTSLLSVLDYIYRNNLIITGNGSFYKQHSDITSPATGMLLEFKSNRTIMKNKMFECQQAHNEVEYIIYKLAQNNEKVSMNSFYGAMGESNSFQYNVSTAGAITAQGRSIITTTAWFMESFISNNVFFESTGDISHYIDLILHESDNLEYYSWIEYIPSDTEIIKYFMSKLENKDPSIRHNAKIFLIMTLNNCTETEKIKLYYKCNLMELIDKNPKIKNHIIDNIINVNCDWMNPNKIPEELSEANDLLWNIVEEFVYMKKYIMYDKVLKFKYHKRKNIVYSDTDSVFIYSGAWLFKFLYYLRGCEIKDIDMNQLMTEKPFILKIINILMRLIYIGIHKTYDTLLDNVHVSQEWRKYVNIKNEFLMNRYISFQGIQKNYINRCIVQEGRILEPPVDDMKGGNVNAKSKNPIVTNRIKNIIIEELLDGNKIKPERMLNKLIEFKYEIIDSLKKGETKYLVPIKVKSPEEYKNPYSIHAYCAVYAYMVASEDQSITIPGSFQIIKVNMGKLDDMQWLKNNYPVIYERFEKNYFSNKKFKSIEYIAIPSRMETLPDWIRYYIDIDKMWALHVKPLVRLLPSVGIMMDTIKSENYYSTILNF